MKQLQNNKILRKVWKYLMIMVGAAIYAAAFQFFHFPNEICNLHKRVLGLEGFNESGL